MMRRCRLVGSCGCGNDVLSIPSLRLTCVNGSVVGQNFSNSVRGERGAAAAILIAKGMTGCSLSTVHREYRSGVNLVGSGGGGSPSSAGLLHGRTTMRHSSSSNNNNNNNNNNNMGKGSSSSGGSDGGSNINNNSSSESPAMNNASSSIFSRLRSARATIDDHRRRMTDEASRKGFVRRDDADSHALLNDTFIQAEIIADGVRVVNLPPPSQPQITSIRPRGGAEGGELASTDAEQEFGVYKRSTRDFTSQVTPFGTVGVGLGAGFGAAEDKRLGFLRPRKLQPVGMDPGLAPKYDENGMPVDESLSPPEQMRRRVKYLKSFDGTTLSPREHFLLVDLDFQKDSVLFGNTREEFEENVIKMKRVILNYQKWEKTDNFYYYTTILLKFMTAFVLMECVNQRYDYQLLRGTYDDFATITEEDMERLEVDRERDFARAREELRVHRPDFEPVVRAIREEKRRLRRIELEEKRKEEESTRVVDSALAAIAPILSASPTADGSGKGTSSPQSESAKASESTEPAAPTPVPTSQEPAAPGEEEVAAALTSVVGLGTATVTRVVQQAEEKEVDTPLNRGSIRERAVSAGKKGNIVIHPMDTSRETEFEVYKTSVQTQRELSRLQESVLSSDDNNGARNYGFWRSVKDVLLFRRYRDSGRHDSDESIDRQPLLQSDYVKLSYAASPTSIDVIRTLRRVMLPRTEDFTQIVKEEMLAYREEKDRDVKFPE